MKRGKTILTVIAILLICISTLSAKTSFCVAAINPNIGTMESKTGNTHEGLAIQSTTNATYKPFVIVVNKMDKNASDFDNKGLRGASGVFTINGNKEFVVFWKPDINVSWNDKTITYKYTERAENKDDKSKKGNDKQITKTLQVTVGNVENGFYNLIVIDNGKKSNLSFKTVSSSDPNLKKSDGTYTLSIPENHRSPIRLYVDGAEISLEPKK